MGPMSSTCISKQFAQETGLGILEQFNNAVEHSSVAELVRACLSAAVCYMISNNSETVLQLTTQMWGRYHGRL